MAIVLTLRTQYRNYYLIFSQNNIFFLIPTLSLDLPIKVFTNSLTVLNQQTLGKTDHVHCFQTWLIESCLVVWSWVDKRPVCFFPYFFFFFSYSLFKVDIQKLRHSNIVSYNILIKID